MATTYEPIATNTLGSDTANVTFSSISGSYTDLILVMSASEASNAFNIELNSDTSSNYSRTRLLGDGSTATSGRTANTTNIPINYLGGTNNFSTTLVHFMNYSNTTTFKTLLARWNQILGIDNSTTTSVGLWRSTAAVTSITFVASAGNFNSGSSFTIYGVKAA